MNFSISRLFFTVFYQNHHFHPCRIYCCMVICVWIISIVLPIEPLLVRACIYQSEFCLCIATPPYLSSTLYIMILKRTETIERYYHSRWNIHTWMHANNDCYYLLTITGNCY
jgi:hypothetical protein